MAIFLRFMTWRVGAEAPFPGWDMGVLRMAPLRNRTRLEFRSEYPANDSSQASPSDHCIWRALKSSLRSYAVSPVRGSWRLSRLVAISSWGGAEQRSEEPTSELQSLMRISYAVFSLKTKNIS